MEYTYTTQKQVRSGSRANMYASLKAAMTPSMPFPQSSKRAPSTTEATQWRGLLSRMGFARCTF